MRAAGGPAPAVPRPGRADRAPSWIASPRALAPALGRGALRRLSLRRLPYDRLHRRRQLPGGVTQPRQLGPAPAQLPGPHVSAEGATHLNTPAGPKPLLKPSGIV